VVVKIAAFKTTTIPAAMSTSSNFTAPLAAFTTTNFSALFAAPLTTNFTLTSLTALPDFTPLTSLTTRVGLTFAALALTLLNAMSIWVLVTVVIALCERVDRKDCKKDEPKQ
jgi:hypothetical protein